MEKEELYGEDRLAAETRIRNLLWTVSGDYDLSCELDIDSFQKAKEISLYDAYPRRIRCSGFQFPAVL